MGQDARRGRDCVTLYTAHEPHGKRPGLDTTEPVTDAHAFSELL